MLHTVCDQIRGHVASAAVHCEEAPCVWVYMTRFCFQDSGQPFVCVTVRRPAAVARREAPVAGRVSWYPSRVGVLCFKNAQRRDRGTSSSHAFDRCYPLLAAGEDLPT